MSEEFAPADFDIRLQIRPGQACTGTTLRHRHVSRPRMTEESRRTFVVRMPRVARALHWRELVPSTVRAF